LNQKEAQCLPGANRVYEHWAYGAGMPCLLGVWLPGANRWPDYGWSTATML